MWTLPQLISAVFLRMGWDRFGHIYHRIGMPCLTLSIEQLRLVLSSLPILRALGKSLSAVRSMLTAIGGDWGHDLLET